MLRKGVTITKIPDAHSLAMCVCPWLDEMGRQTRTYVFGTAGPYRYESHGCLLTLIHPPLHEPSRSSLMLGMPRRHTQHFTLSTTDAQRACTQVREHARTHACVQVRPTLRPLRGPLHPLTHSLTHSRVPFSCRCAAAQDTDLACGIIMPTGFCCCAHARVTPAQHLLPS